MKILPPCRVLYVEGVPGRLTMGWKMRRRGFSLIELLVVMAILAVLMAIMVPPMYHFIQYVRHLGG